MKTPAFQFYPADWLKDPGLRRCPHAVKGVWIDIICLMSECDERGVLATGGAPWTDEEIALAVGGDQAVVIKAILELTLKGVAKRREDGALINSRMVRDENKRRLCQEAGKRGGNPNLLATLKGSGKGADKGDPNRNPTPSTSTSTSTSVDKADIIDPDLEKPKKKSKSKRNISDEEFIAELKANPAYSGIDIDREIGKMRGWLLSKPGRQLTRQFIVNWLNKVDRPVTAPTWSPSHPRATKTLAEIRAEERERELAAEKQFQKSIA